jgi:hypothetical protein
MAQDQPIELAGIGTLSLVVLNPQLDLAKTCQVNQNRLKRLKVNFLSQMTLSMEHHLKGFQKMNQ